MEINKFKKSEKLALKNDGRLSLFFLGIGSAFTKRNYQTNLLIIKGDDHLMVDCGTKSTQALFDVGLSIVDIHNFLITHSHADHIGGLEEAAIMGRYFAKKKPTMVITEAYQHILWDMSLRGGCAHNEEEAGDILTFQDFWEINRPELMSEFKRQTFGTKVGDLDIKIMRTKHIPDSSDSWECSFWSCGMIIDEKIMFTSDTRYDPELILEYDKKYDLEIIFHDCQFFTGGVHASYEELNELPAEIKKKMYLTHYGDNWEDFTEKIKKCGFAGLTLQQTYYDFK